jgi:hypothetical protein
VYSIIDFNAYLLSKSTILNNSAALHLVNNRDMLVNGIFKKIAHLETIEAGT